MTPEQVLATIPWVAPYTGALLVLALNKTEKLKQYIGVLVLLISAISSTLLLFSSWGKTVELIHPWIPSIGINLHLYVDSLSSVMAFVVAWLSFLIGFYSLKYMEHDKSLTRYWFFFDFFVGSMLLLILAGNMIIMFLGWEGTGLASYSLIGHWFTDEEEKCVGDVGRKALGIPMWFTPSHGGLRALVFTRLGDVGFMFGTGILFALGVSSGLTNPLEIPVIAEMIGDYVLTLHLKGILYLFLLFFSLGAMAKSAQVPFHEWLVTAMTGPTSVSALIHAATMVKAGVYFMLRFVPIFCLASEHLEHMIHAEHVEGAANGIELVAEGALNAIHSYFATIAWIGGITAFMLATMALVAREMKLVLAFSTASQLGYMFLGAGATGLVHEVIKGYLATFGHLISHADFKACLFLGAGAIMHAVESKYIDDCGGLHKYMKFSWIFLLLAVLSLAGVPPFMGFWTKDSILDIAYEAQVLGPYLLGTLTAALTAFYSFRWISLIFFREESRNVEHLVEEHKMHEAHWIMLGPYGILAIIAVLLGALWPIVGPSVLKTMGINVLGLEVPHEFEFKPELTPELTLISCAMVALGLSIAFTMYLRPRYDAVVNEFISARKPLTMLREWLYDRWYVNSIYYTVFVRGGAAFSRGLNRFTGLVVDGFYHKFLPKLFGVLSDKGFSFFETLFIDGVYHRLIPKLTNLAATLGFSSVETKVIDEGYNVRMVDGVLNLGSIFRRIQSGKINHYLLMFFAGLMAMTIVLVVIWL